MEGLSGGGFILILIFATSVDAYYPNNRYSGSYGDSSNHNSRQGFNDDNTGSGLDIDGRNQLAAVVAILALAPFLIFAIIGLVASGGGGTSATVTGAGGGGGGGTATTGAVITGASGRRRRSADSVDFFVDVLAQHVDQEEFHRMLVDDMMPCLLQLACNLGNEKGAYMKTDEKEVKKLVLDKVLNNSHIKPEVRRSITKASSFGQKSPASCATMYKCKS